jgi:hypothetical protein
MKRRGISDFIIDSEENQQHLPFSFFFLSGCCSSVFSCFSNATPLYFSVPTFIPGWFVMSSWPKSILFRIFALSFEKIYSMLVPSFAELSTKSILFSLASRIPYS